MRESVNDGFGAYVLKGDSGRPTREAVNKCEKVGMTFGLRHHRDVSMDVRETFVGYGELVNRGYGVTANLGSLAVEAVSGPS